VSELTPDRMIPDPAMPIDRRPDRVLRGAGSATLADDLTRAHELRIALS